MLGQEEGEEEEQFENKGHPWAGQGKRDASGKEGPSILAFWLWHPLPSQTNCIH